MLGYKAYIVLTGSMEPTIDPGDIVVVKKVPVEQIKEWDIITFSLKDNESVTVTHRVVKIENEDGQKKYITKGDNNNSEDLDKVEPKQIQGIYKFKIKKIGSIISTLLTGIGLFIIIIIVAISYMHSRNKEDTIIEREEARKKFNTCKYKKD